MSRPDGADPAADDDVRVDDSQPEPPDPDEMAQVEHEGQTYIVPAALKGALMRQADYTRGVHALDQHRQVLEAAHQALAMQAQAQHEHLMDHARLAGMDDHIGRMSQLNWPALQQQNPAQAQQLLTQLFQMRQAREIAAGQLQHKQNVMAFNRQREHARQVEQGHAELARQIEGWSPQMAATLAQFAMDQGISPEELNHLSDPRLVKILHYAHAGHAAQKQTSAAQRLIKAQAVRPAIQVGGTGGAPQDPNRMSTDDWMRHRRGQLRTKAK